MSNKESNVIVSLGNISSQLVQINRNLNEGNYNETNLDKLQETLQEVYTKLQNWI